MEILGLNARYLAIDSSYKISANAHYLIEKINVTCDAIYSFVKKEVFFKSCDFIYDEYYRSYICPNDIF